MSIAPSSLFSDDNVYDKYANLHNKDYSLSVGIIIKQYLPEDEENKSKHHVEYDVVTVNQDESGAPNPYVYRHCTGLDSFGSIADFMTVKRRVAKKNIDEEEFDQYDFPNGDGAYVLLLCANGSQDNAIILGGVPHPNRKKLHTNTEEDNVSMESEFNGVNFSVTEDGGLKILFRGATDNLGKPKDASKGGTRLEIDKEGNFEVNNKKLSESEKKDNKLVETEESAAKEESGGDAIEYEKIKISTKEKKLDIESRDDMSLKTDKNINITAKTKAIFEVNGFEVTAEGSAKVTAASSIDLKADGPMKLKGSVLELESDGSVKIKGSILTIEAQMVEVKGSMIMLGDGGMPALNMATQFIGVGNLSIPVISTVMAGMSGTVMIAS